MSDIKEEVGEYIKFIKNPSLTELLGDKYFFAENDNFKKLLIFFDKYQIIVYGKYKLDDNLEEIILSKEILETQFENIENENELIEKLKCKIKAMNHLIFILSYESLKSLHKFACLMPTDTLKVISNLMLTKPLNKLEGLNKVNTLNKYQNHEFSDLDDFLIKQSQNCYICSYCPPRGQYKNFVCGMQLRQDEIELLDNETNYREYRCSRDIGKSGKGSIMLPEINPITISAKFAGKRK
jgi:hypothetical protein